ncbi:MAG: hypothetical protein QM743_01750 [Chitinophagaceae bacterium]|uniref:DUF4834 family protein n=1 Tax=Rurimicrobium arvi TaxID=2049916 RepID=A0ABP8MIP2_9BACT
MLSHWIIYGLFLYVIYKFVRNFLFPAVRITNTMNQKMNEMQQRMQEMHQEEQRRQQQQQRPKSVEGEYIDYEEVK